jgi:hypothetical protein
LTGPAHQAVIDSVRQAGDKREQETRFYITSVRCWPRCSRSSSIATGYRNSLYCVMDMVFRDDGMPAENRSRPSQLLRHQALSAEPHQDGSRKGFFRLEGKAARWDDDVSPAPSSSYADIPIDKVRPKQYLTLLGWKIF